MTQSATHPALRVDCLTAPAEWQPFAPAWRELCDRAGLSPLMTPEWWHAHVTCFEQPAACRLLVVWRGSTLAGVLPLIAERGWLRGVPVRRWRAAAGHHTLGFDMVCDPAQAAAVAVALWSWLEAAVWRGEWSYLELRDVPAGGAAERLPALAQAAGCPVGKWRSPIATRPVPDIAAALAGTAGLAHPSRKFRAELRRTRRRLEEDLGRVRLEAVMEPEPAAMQEFFSLEAAGWKGGAGGNAILRKPAAVRRYYEILAGGAAAQNRFRLHRLWAGLHPLAMSFSLLAPGALIPLRWCYDERLARYGPGHLLIESLLSECVVQGRTRFAFLGEAFEYECKWAPAGSPHSFLFIFPPTRWGRWLRYLKFGRAGGQTPPSGPAASV